MDIQVIKVDPYTRRVSFELTHNPLTGVMKLVQIVVLSLLNDPGKDILDPEKGGGFPSMIGMNIDTEDTTELFGEIAQRVKKTQTEIINDQVGLDISAEEKLRDLAIMEIVPGEIDEIFVKLRVINEAGKVTDLVL